MTPLRVSIVAAAISFALLFTVLELVRTRRLRERYALMWILTAAVLITLSLWRTGLDTIAGLVGIHYAPSALFAIAAVFIVLVLLHYSTVISRLSDENAVLAQRVALLEAERAGAPARREREPVDAEGEEPRIRRAAADELRPIGRDPKRRRRRLAAADGQRERD
ncbi:MAG TPA: DUF2304 domain-containing protein [Gaiellaceae bacterium]|nr:DUF2304 domain-containing protein [Gaiellaceae bacterium]